MARNRLQKPTLVGAKAWVVPGEFRLAIVKLRTSRDTPNPPVMVISGFNISHLTGADHCLTIVCSMICENLALFLTNAGNTYPGWPIQM